MKSVRKKNKLSFLISQFQNLVDEKNRQRTEDVINLIRRKGAEIKDNKRENKKNENKKNDSNDDNDKNNKCRKCDRVSYSKKECSTINSECSES
jgi:hypothetical protein